MNDVCNKVMAVRDSATASLISKSENIRYLCGFTGEGALLLTGGNGIIITDFRYGEQAAQQSPGFEVQLTAVARPANTIIMDALSMASCKGLYVEKASVSALDYELMTKELLGISLLAAGGEVEALREIKRPDELDHIRRAVKLTDAAFDYLLDITRPGISELEIVALLYKFFLDNGSEGFSFAPIVASGENSSKPHAIAGNRKIRIGDMVTFDFGCLINGYCSDFTRTVAIGAIDPELKKIYNIVLEANMRVLSKIADGVPCVDADAAARAHISAHGYGANFGHGTGHGVGLEIHEAPRLGASSTQVLKAGMVVSDEPGIYIAGKGGVRIEDLVLVNNGGCEVLSTATKQLIVL